MAFALTTRWNAGRHTTGEEMITEILELGFSRVELGYDLRMDLVPGVKQMVAEGAVAVDSLHSLCPIPLGAPRGHPELFTLADPDPRVRDNAVKYLRQTINFAAEIGASVVVVHSGNVKMKHFTHSLAALSIAGRQFTAKYERLHAKLHKIRDKKVAKQLPLLYDGLEKLLPILDETGVQLAIENLPTWESIPTELEMQAILDHFNHPCLRYWHDLGHGRIRQNMHHINQERWLEKFLPYMAGMHIHDVLPPMHDHLMPPLGEIDFERLKHFDKLPILKVFEPTPATPRDQIVTALHLLREIWETEVVTSDKEKREQEL